MKVYYKGRTSTDVWNDIIKHREEYIKKHSIAPNVLEISKEDWDLFSKTIRLLQLHNEVNFPEKWCIADMKVVIV